MPIVDFEFLADLRLKLKESEKGDKYQDLLRKLKKNWINPHLRKFSVTQTPVINHLLILVWLRKGSFKRETESLQIAAQNNAVRTNHIKTRIDKTQQNSKCRLCGYRDETINHIISECRKLAQKEYKTRHDWVGKVIHWEMSNKFKFDHTNKCTTQHLS